MTKPFLGIAFGGGGVRGAAHIGVLQVLHKAGITAEIVSGVSAGSIVAAMYAMNLDPFWVENKFREIWESDSFQKASRSIISNGNRKSLFNKITKIFVNHIIAIMSLHKKSIIKNKQLEEALNSLFADIHFKDLKIPLKVVATDINSGKDIVYDRGSLVDAILQSSSIPGVLEPIFKEKKIIVDGGVGMPIPVSVIKNHCEFTIAIDIGMYRLRPIDRINAVSIKKRAEIITSNRLKKKLSLEADFIINPDTMGMQWSDFYNAEIIFEKGKSAAEDTISILKEKIKERKKEIQLLNNS